MRHKTPIIDFRVGDYAPTSNSANLLATSTSITFPPR